jgi:hypothetical protein
LKCGLQKSARRISGRCAPVPSGGERIGLAWREPRCPLAGVSRSMPGERVRDTFVQRLRPGEVCWFTSSSSRILGTTEGASGRMRHLIPNPDGVRSLLAQEVKLSGSRSRVRAGPRPLQSAGDRVGTDPAVPTGRHRGVRGLSDAGKAHPAVKARWVGSRASVATRSARGIVVALPEAGKS